MIEIERSGPSYAVDTVAELKGQFGAEDELFFILGWDSLKELPQWQEPSRLIKLCRLVAVPRVGSSAPDLKSMEAAIPGLEDRVILLDKPRVDISASEIRGRVARGLPIDHLVPEPVERYIREQGLYTIA
jgi:nicotinate-nucleotide adenylyltransferase